MDLYPMMIKAAAELTDIVRGVKPDQLSAPTPCEGWELRQLVTHVRHWAPALEAAARKRPVTLDGAEGDRDLSEGDWQDAYVADVERIIEAWRDPAAWEGTSSMGGGNLPATFYAQMTFAEFVVHGWDFARASGQRFHCDDAVATTAYTVIVGMAEKGRAMGAFGPEVPVAETSSTLERALGLSGRDPSWQA